MEEGEDGDVDENGVAISSKRVCHYYIYLLYTSHIPFVDVRVLCDRWILVHQSFRHCLCNSCDSADSCRRFTAWKGGGGEWV